MNLFNKFDFIGAFRFSAHEIPFKCSPKLGVFKLATSVKELGIVDHGLECVVRQEFNIQIA